MTKAENYMIVRMELMEEWAKQARKWLKEENNQLGERKFEENANFFKDGVVDPETWFASDFRPLFILKEVHDTDEQIGRNIDFIAQNEDKEYDVWNARGGGMWQALATLSQGMICKVENKQETRPYEELYEQNKNICNYRETLKRIAILNVKKLAGGGKVNSEDSMRTKLFSCHACKFQANLRKQIKSIEPTVIICMGDDVGKCFEIQNDKMYDIPVVVGLHPSVNCNCRRDKYYYETIEKVEQCSIL